MASSRGQFSRVLEELAAEAVDEGGFQFVLCETGVNQIVASSCNRAFCWSFPYNVFFCAINMLLSIRI